MENKIALSPSAEVWRKTLKPGYTVWWNDPDKGKSSGYYFVERIDADGEDLNEDTLFVIKNSAGSVAEVLGHELIPQQPEGLYLVVDGETNADGYGYASSKEEAVAVGNETFADEVHWAYLAEDIRLGNGMREAKAWVAMTSPRPELAKLRLVLDVEYDLSGESIDELKSNLHRMVNYAVGNGMLTGDLSATVEDWSASVREMPKPLTEEELAAFMLRRIENQQIALEDIPVRLARYGLMDPVEFVAEMRERLENEKEEA